MVAVTVTLHGPVFDGRAGPWLRDAEKAAVQDQVEYGERRVQSQLYPGHGLITGNYRRGIIGEVGISIGGGASGAKDTSASLRGRATRDVARDGLAGVVYDSGIVYGPWLEGVSSRNARTRFKGYAMFRNATQDIDRRWKRVMTHHVNRALRRM